MDSGNVNSDFLTVQVCKKIRTDSVSVNNVVIIKTEFMPIEPYNRELPSLHSHRFFYQDEKLLLKGFQSWIKNTRGSELPLPVQVVRYVAKLLQLLFSVQLSVLCI